MGADAAQTEERIQSVLAKAITAVESAIEDEISAAYEEGYEDGLDHSETDLMVAGILEDMIDEMHEYVGDHPLDVRVKAWKLTLERLVGRKVL